MNADRPDPPSPSDPSEPSDETPRDEGPLDVDAAFADIVANFEVSDDPSHALPPSAVEDPGSVVEEPGSVVEEPEGRGRLETPDDPGRLETPFGNLFAPMWPDTPPKEATWEDEGHFVPPPPPPIPRAEPRRLAAWIGLFGAPILGLVLLVAGVAIPRWFSFFLSAAFVGGFGYLVATMGSSSDGDGWDDGARL